MSRSNQPRQGDVVGGWRVQGELGSGGNGQVWRAQRDGQTGALKILKRPREGSERSRRFEREIREHRRLSDEGVSGVLPVLAAVDPDDAAERRLWIVTALSEKMSDVSPDLSIEERVEAIASIADTLARLHEQGVTHRDIKPDNLFHHQGQWVVGDFGLVDRDNGHPAITEAGRPVGPRHYIAPEMITDPSTAEGAPADVYSLAKTLWVTLTGQRYPLPGRHEPYEPLMRLSSFVEHPRLGPLDLLIAQATQPRPDKRPTSHEFARELDLWLQELEPTTTAEGNNLEDIHTRWAHMSRPGVELQEARTALDDQVAEALVALQRALAPVEQAYTVPTLPAPILEPCEIIASWTHISKWVLLMVEQGSATGFCVRVTHALPQTSGGIGGGERWASLHSGFAVRRCFDGTLYIGVGHVICQYDRSPQVIFEAEDKARAGSVALTHTIRDLTNRLTETVPEALRAFLGRIAELGT